MKIIVIKPSGFCAGVVRAVGILDAAIKKFGTPIYVVHEIVHNKMVVEEFKQKGAIFVNSLEDVPSYSRVVLSAHGSPKATIKEGQQKNLHIINAVCPLVSGVHDAVVNFDLSGHQVILIGHKDHVEVVGTKGQIEKEVLVVSNEDEARKIAVKDPKRLAFVTQTTLNFNDIRGIIGILQERFPNIKGPKKSNICYATRNRQDALKVVLPEIELLLVVGSQNSSNGNRLCDIGKENGKKSFMINSFKDIDEKWLNGIGSVGITAAASAPKNVIGDVIKYLEQKFDTNAITREVCEENVKFSFPEELL